MPKFKVKAKKTIEVLLTVDVPREELDEGELDEEAAVDLIENADDGELETLDEGTWEVESIHRAR